MGSAKQPGPVLVWQAFRSCLIFPTRSLPFGFIIEAAAKTGLTDDFRYAFVRAVAQCHRIMVRWTKQELLLSSCGPSHKADPLWGGSGPAAFPARQFWETEAGQTPGGKVCSKLKFQLLYGLYWRDEDSATLTASRFSKCTLTDSVIHNWISFSLQIAE